MLEELQLPGSDVGAVDERPPLPELALGPGSGERVDGDEALLQESEKAHIFNIGSVAGAQGFPGNTAYCASKYGLRGFGDALRLDLAEQGIRVSTVQPGNTDTTIYDDVEGEWDRTGWNQPEDVAEVVWQAYNTPADTDVSELSVPQRG